MKKESIYKEKIDTVLRFLSTSAFAQGHNTDDYILRQINKNKALLTAGELIKILQKLVRDGYVTSYIPSNSTFSVYSISLDGEIFYNKGGYQLFELKELLPINFDYSLLDAYFNTDKIEEFKAIEQEMKNLVFPLLNMFHYHYYQ